MSRWLSFWNKETRRLHHHPEEWWPKHPQKDPWDIWIYAGAAGERNVSTPLGTAPRSAAKSVQVGDLVYCVSIDQGELLLHGRVEVERMALDRNNPRQLNVWAVGEPEFFFSACRVSPTVADGIVYANKDGTTTTRIKRDAHGWLLGNAFQGPNSVRELVDGFDALDRIIEAR